MKIKYQDNYFFQAFEIDKIILSSLFQHVLKDCLESVLSRSPIQNRTCDFVYYPQTWLWMKMLLGTMHGKVLCISWLLAGYSVG